MGTNMPHKSAPDCLKHSSTPKKLPVPPYPCHRKLTREGKRDGVGGPETGCHEDEQNVSGREVVDCAYCDGCDHEEGEPAGDDEAAVGGDFVGEDAAYGGTDEGECVDGNLGSG